MTIRRARIGIRLLFQKSIKEILIQAGRIEGIAASSMRQRQPGRRPDVGLGDLATALPSGMGSCRSGSHNVCTHAVDLKRRADSGDGRQLSITEAYRRQKRSGIDDADP
jgi:hypothetical protein